MQLWIKAKFAVFIKSELKIMSVETFNVKRLIKILLNFIVETRIGKLIIMVSQKVFSYKPQCFLLA